MNKFRNIINVSTDKRNEYLADNLKLSGGFTIIEMLVVIMITSLLIGLIIPAIQSSRNESKRIECSNHLKNIGVALANHESSRLFWPSPMPSRRIGEDGQILGPRYLLSGYYELLPYLDYTALFNAINSPEICKLNEPHFVPIFHPTMMQIRVDTFLCPSDRYTSSSVYAPTSYRFNVGLDADPDNNQKNKGVFIEKYGTYPKQCTDGFSTTVAFSERVVGSFRPTSFHPRRDYWFSGLIHVVDSYDEDLLLNLCQKLNSKPISYSNDLGSSWMRYRGPDLTYNHVLPPNAVFADCTLGGIGLFSEDSCVGCAISARSEHANGVNALLLDGSVKFIKSSINLNIWRALGTKAGRETIEGEW